MSELDSSPVQAPYQRGLLDAWWDRVVAEEAQKMLPPQRPLPHDGAAWACMVNFFAVVGLADAQIKVTYVSPMPILVKLIQLWEDAKKSKIQVGQ